MSEEVMGRDVVAESAGVDVGPNSPRHQEQFTSPTKYPWRLEICDSALHRFFYENEADARAAYDLVAPILRAGADYKNDTPRLLTLTDAISERTLTTIGLRSAAVINAAALHTDDTEVWLAQLRHARALLGDGLGQASTLDDSPTRNSTQEDGGR